MPDRNSLDGQVIHAARCAYIDEPHRVAAVEPITGARTAIDDGHTLTVENDECSGSSGILEQHAFMLRTRATFTVLPVSTNLAACPMVSHGASAPPLFESLPVLATEYEAACAVQANANEPYRASSDAPLERASVGRRIRRRIFIVNLLVDTELSK
jgi:hypothetical protein